MFSTLIVKVALASSPKTICLSIVLVTKISDYFNVSRLAVLLRYVEIGAYPLMIAYCKNGILEWFERNEEFPHKAFRTKVGKELPINSTVGEYFRVGDYINFKFITSILARRKIEGLSFFY